MTEDDLDDNRRHFLTVATAVTGAVGVGAALVPFLSSLKPSARAQALGAPVQVPLAAMQPGFLGVESVRAEVGITVSYWRDLESISCWKAHAEHRQAQKLGRAEWYAKFKVRIARVEREYGVQRSRWGG